MLRGKVIPVLKRIKKMLNTCIFQQDTAHDTVLRRVWLKESFGDTLILRKAGFSWPPYSSDLNPAELFLWGYLKERVYSCPVPKTVEQLNNNLRRKVKRLKIDVVKR